ncbi:VOC family protein [Planococcus lenghuensis]|uniref:Glyoxalase n=1 Tax=Planococcus lenghuensis TaxID=2213202 RepID=A0A1Q2L277_9BACL|nr:VOC family protein [Planococcus lenghuensis]AQQ54516.1 glyoxalase [Planococcus lenghuensis]
MRFHQKPIMHVSQVNLKVQNIDRSLAFYTSVIGLSVLNRTETSGQLTADGKTVLVSLEQPEGVTPKQPRTTGLYHFAILLPERSDLAAIVRHFTQIDLQFGASDHLVSEALYFSDPDGNGIEIYRDRDPDEWTWNGEEVVMTVDPLDFDDLLENSEPKEWQGLPADTAIGHIHLHTGDLQRSEQFYTEGLGLDIVCRYGSQASFISAGKYHHHIGINTWNGVGAPPPSPHSAGLASYSLMLPDENTRLQIIERLKAKEAPVSEADHGFTTEDPSGNRIQLLV